MRHQKAKNRKIGCKNNQMYLFLTGNSHFVECSFWFWVLINSFQTALDQRTTISSLPPKKGWRNCCHPDFFQYSCGFPGFLRSIFQNRPTVDVQPPKEQKQQKTAFLIKIGKRFCHFLDTGREMIFDGPFGLSWSLTGEGGNSFLPAAGTEETIKQPSFSSMETDIFPFSQFKWWRSSAGRTILPNPSIVRKYCTAITSRRLDFQFPSGLFQRFIYRL